MISLVYSGFVDLINSPPHSLWFILVISLGVSILSTGLNKILVDHEQMDRIQTVITEHNKKKKALLALSEENPKRYAKEYPKWQRRDASIQKMQQSMSLNRLKPTCITFIPMIVFFYVIRNLYTGPSGIQMPTAKPPMNASDLPLIAGMVQSEFYSVMGNIPILEGFLGFTGYYFLCSLSISTMMQRIMGISRPQNQGMGQMFDTSASMDLPDPKNL